MRFASFIFGSFLLIVSTAPLAVGSDGDSSQETSLNAKGERLLRQGDWQEAARIFEQLAGRFPNSPRLGSYLFQRAKADYYFGDYDKALAGFGRFVARFGTSPYRGYAEFFSGNIHYFRGNLSRALYSYIEAYGHAADVTLMNLLEQSISGVVSGAKSVSIGPADFETLESEKRCQLIRLVSDVLLERGDLYSAQNILEVCGESVDEQTRSILQDRIGDRDLELAVVLPFSGELQSFGDEIYNGAVIAAEYCRNALGLEIKLQPIDTKGDPINAARIIREAINSSYDAAVGPLTSEEAAMASAALNCGELPLIVPAATQAGLTELSRSMFQMSPNIELQAVRMAEYAVLNLHADSAAVITSTDADHLRMSRAFVRRFTQLGGEVIATEYYRPRDKDFGAYIRDIKAMLLGVPGDSVFFIDDRGDTIDVEGIPVSLDCLYLPGNSSQLRLLLPQMRYYSFNAAYLGSDGWGDEAVSGLGDEVTRFAVYPSPFLQWGSGEEYSNLAAAYDARFGEAPQRLATLGYDAVRVIASATLNGGHNRELLIRKLSELDQYQGAAATITFGEHRENKEMPVYRIESGAPVPVTVSQTVADTEN